MRMRKLLQNKKVVSCLAIIAVLSVAANFVKLPSLKTFNAVAREPETPISATGTTVFEVPGITRFSRRYTNWQTLLPIDVTARDPFAPVTSGIPTIARGSVTNPSFPGFALQGVSIEGDRAFAVINQTVVTQGESLSGYRVDRIDPGQVALSGRAGTLVVHMVSPSAIQNSPTANAPNADLSHGKVGPGQSR